MFCYYQEISFKKVLNPKFIYITHVVLIILPKNASNNMDFIFKEKTQIQTQISKAQIMLFNDNKYTQYS